MNAALDKLPRDSRDTLFLLLVIAAVLAPQVAHLPPWCSLLAATVLLWRGWLAWTQRPLPSRWWLLALLALTLAATWWTHRTLLGRDAGVTLIVVLLTLKTLELRARRDAFVVFFLGFFTMLTNFFFSQSLPTAAAMLVALMGLLTALVNTHMPVGKPPLREAARTAALMALLGAPIMALLFLLFPRLAPLWGVPSDAMAGRSGLSASMRVGSIATLALDDSVAMRIRFEDGVQPRSADLYFRGPVLATLDGREWTELRSRLPPRLRERAALSVSGEPVRYEVTLEPHHRSWLLTLDATPERPALPGREARMGEQLQWTSSQPVAELTRYRAVAYPEFSHGPLRRTTGLQDFLALPAGFNPRTLQWAADLRRDTAGADGDAWLLVERVLRELRTGGFSYTLEPGEFGIHTADEFWFERKAGFCEHIASSFVILLRAMDVPARIVTGYQGGERNEIGGFWVVRQRDAHAWTEVWIAGRGWVRVDPTAAVAPGRVGSLQRLQAPRGVLASALEAVSPAAVLNLRAWWDAVNNRWNQWVLNYSQTMQLDLLRDIGFSSPDWADLGYVLIALVVAASLVGAAWTWWDRHRQDPWLALLRRARRRLAEAGMELAPQSPPRALLQALQRQRPGVDALQQQALADWLLRLEALRYAPPAVRRGGDSLRVLQQQFAGLPWPAPMPRTGGATPRSGPPPAATAAVLVLALALVLGGTDTHAAAPQEAAKAMPQPKPRPGAKAKAPPAPASAGARYAGRADVLEAADAIALAEGLDAAWVRATLAEARLQPAIQRAVLPPPAGVPKNWRLYRSRFIDPVRIAAGVAFWQQHAATLERAETLYGVPAAIIVGIIGVETIYGRDTGRHRVLDALATLAFDFPRAHPRAAERQAFFRAELAQFLALAARGTLDATGQRGSYAGAIGLPQFMPSSLARHAVDFDADGRIDLTGSPADAIGSVAAYFRAHGWRTGLPAHYPVQFDAARLDLPTLLAPDIRPSFSPATMAALGVQLGDDALAHPGPLALIELQNADAAPSYVAGSENFYVITRYNWSSYYAMAVIELAESVAQARGR